MHIVVKASVLLAGVVAALTLVVVGTGLHERPQISLPLFIFGAVLLNVAVVFWALRTTASENPYGRQLMNAALIGLVGGALVFVVSMTITGLLFPQFLEQSKAAQAALMESQLSGPALDEALARNASRSSFSEAFGGFVGTLGTSILAGAVVALFLRRR